MSSNCSASAVCASAMREFLLGFGGILIRWASHERGFFEIMFRRRRRGLPFQARRVPWIGGSSFSVLVRPNTINERQDISLCPREHHGARHHDRNQELR